MKISVSRRIKRRIIVIAAAAAALLAASPTWGLDGPRADAKTETAARPQAEAAYRPIQETVGNAAKPNIQTTFFHKSSINTVGKVTRQLSRQDAVKAATAAPVRTGQAEKPEKIEKNEKMEAPADKTVYLTFDDGPSSITEEVLSVLRKEGVKATFFVLGREAERRPDLIRRMAAEGHVIGNHTYDHNYKDLYSGFEAFWGQIKETERIIWNITGQAPLLVRAPGGTYGHFDAAYFKLLKEAGYTVVDWNVDSGDSRRRGVPAAEIIEGSLTGLSKPGAVVLLHDGAGHEASAEALPAIIARYKAAGYVFAVLDPLIEPVQFRIKDGTGTGRAVPGAAWTAAHVTPNRPFLAAGPALAIESGGRTAELAAGQYRLEDGRYTVSLRAVTEGLGGKVVWNAESRTAEAVIGGRSVCVLTGDSPQEGCRKPGTAGGYAVVQGELLDAAVRVPLRELMNAAGLPVTGLIRGQEGVRVIAG